MISAKIKNGSKAITAMICLCCLLVLGGCASSVLQWPDLSISRDEADEALTKEEQSLLKELLSSKQKNHHKDAVKQIESR